ncbi:MAG: AAA domain-containing protein [Myxococcota bacterium]
MTLPEFLAIAVKARRWVRGGDPEQLPPFNNSEENATTLDDLIDPALELVCSVGAILERARPPMRRDERLVVVSSDPVRAASAIRSHLDEVMPENLPPVGAFGEEQADGIVVCSPEECDEACEFLSPVRGRDHTHNPDRSGSLRILVERGLRVARPDFASGTRLVEARVRAQALIFENSFNVYHAQPWSLRSGQKLPLVMFRNGLDKYLPSAAALGALGCASGVDQSAALRRATLIDDIAERFAINAISVYDWLTGIPSEHFDTSPLLEFEALSPAALREAVRPFVGTLKKQYRMHSSLSWVPRELFYFGEALHDGRPDDKPGCRVSLVQVAAEGVEGESNGREAEAICSLLESLNADEAAQERRPGIMVITPYRRQEALLSEATEKLRSRGAIGNLDVEVCTLDRCQGREAEYVLISLVRSRATPFLDMPKRWNVALTRAMQGLFIIGNIDAYLGAAMAARNDPRARPGGRNDQAASSRRDSPARPAGRGGQPRVLMSLLARIIEAYDRQIAANQQARARRAAR